MQKINKTFLKKKDEELSQKDDLIIFDYVAKVDGKDFEGNTGKNIQLVLGKDLFIKGFDQQLIGVKINQSKSVTVKLPENYPKKELANKKTDFDCKIINLKKSVEVKIDDEFAKKMGAKSLEDLKNSIKERGIIQPLIVRKSDDQDDKFELIAGERRWQAAQSAGLHEVPVVIIEADNLKSLELAIIENVQRKDLNPVEEAESYNNLIQNFGYDHEKVSKFIGKSRSHISNSIRLLSLPEKILDLIRNNKISQGHAKVLVGLKNALLLTDKIIKKKLSVRQ